MGFNRGSTRIRQLHTGAVKSHIFESTVIRLMKDHGYVDAYHEGQALPQGPVPSRSIWIFRYYDVADEEFGDGNRREIEFHAKKLSEFPPSRAYRRARARRAQAPLPRPFGRAPPWED